MLSLSSQCNAFTLHLNAITLRLNAIMSLCNSNSTQCYTSCDSVHCCLHAAQCNADCTDSMQSYPSVTGCIAVLYSHSCIALHCIALHCIALHVKGLISGIKDENTTYTVCSIVSAATVIHQLCTVQTPAGRLKTIGTT